MSCMTVELDLPDFYYGSPRQRKWAETIRIDFVHKHLEFRTGVEDIQLVLSLRRDAEYWVTNRDQVWQDATFQQARTLISEHGSLWEAVSYLYQNRKKKVDAFRSVTPLGGVVWGEQYLDP